MKEISLSVVLKFLVSVWGQCDESVPEPLNSVWLLTIDIIHVCGNIGRMELTEFLLEWTINFKECLALSSIW
jgi:hypothetical protein